MEHTGLWIWGREFDGAAAFMTYFSVEVENCSWWLRREIWTFFEQKSDSSLIQSYSLRLVPELFQFQWKGGDRNTYA